jgi:hypothetical protein
MDVERVRSLATAFRNAIEKCERSKLPASFGQFPHGSCGDTVLLLGAFFIDKLGVTFGHVYGEWGTSVEDFATHAWIERNGVVIDITADQFNEIDERVIVRRKSDWHDVRRASVEGVADFRRYDPKTVAGLGRGYAAILACISTDESGIAPKQ